MKVRSSSLNTVCVPGRERVGLPKGNLLFCARPGPIWDAHYQYLFVFLATSLLPFKWSPYVHLSSSRVNSMLPNPADTDIHVLALPQSCSSSACSFRRSLLRHTGFCGTTFCGVSSDLLPCLLQSSLTRILHHVAGC